MRIMIIGGGSLGLLFASKMAAYCSQLTVVTRTREQAIELTRVGITRNERESQEHVNESSLSFCSYIDEMNVDRTLNTPNPRLDYIFLMVKQTAITSELLQFIQNHISIATYLVSFQNGIGHEWKLSQAIGEDRLLLAVTTEGAKRNGYTAVNHTGHGITYIGEMASNEEGAEHNQHNLLVQVLEQAGFQTVLSKNMEVRVWSKLAINAVINPLTALLRMRNGELLESAWTLDLMNDLYQEVQSVAYAQGIRLPDDLWDTILGVCEATSRNHSSMLQDIEASRHTEVDYMNGSLLRLAKESDLSLPTHSMIYRMIKALEK
ncbi:hypothetical protein A8709_24330 [Paenibacillus pectinilyticus]|uniref:2-dehydropantoate 2-reductase n=1 Tax=Paenibacillus pectinilyticus TaxID=512399 RepID=A0A1C1A928_9BACL|nr:2-dehydropantoate 2-reductase [Paenibacillus pectinilyticus]OCT17115.1 hypothetical protein A8709_24330 [Paenibacillus pectinilyticus]